MRAGKQEQQDEGRDPEEELLTFTDSWVGACGVGVAWLWLAVEFVEGETEERKREEDKERSERLHFGE